MFRIVLTVIISAIVFYSCESGSNKTNDDNNVTLDDINKLESELYGTNTGAPDMEKAKLLASHYVDYADLYPNDSNSVEFLFKASDIYMNTGDPKLTLTIFNKILSQYPDYRNIPIVMFLKGFVYEDQLHDYTNAKKYYLEFLDKYPDSDFADDAIVSINNLGKSPEELIKEFESKSNN